jgi:hypothetical protein
MGTTNVADWEVSAIDADGNYTGNVLGQLTGTETTYTADGDINLTDKSAILEATSASTAMDLADGTYIGQELIVSCTASTSTATVTIASPLSGASDVVTFTAGDLAIFRWTSAGWGAVQGVAVA